MSKTAATTAPGICAPPRNRRRPRQCRTQQLPTEKPTARTLRNNSFLLITSENLELSVYCHSYHSGGSHEGNIRRREHHPQECARGISFSRIGTSGQWPADAGSRLGYRSIEPEAAEVQREVASAIARIAEGFEL